MPESLRGRHDWGGIALSYTGAVLEVWAQITFHGVGGGSIDETFNIIEEPGSDTREAVWWMPRNSTAIIALGNSSSSSSHVTAQFSNGETQQIEIPSGATKFIRRAGRGFGESVKLITTVSEESVRVAGFIIGRYSEFSSSIRFYDTRKIVQPNLYGVNLRLKNAAPRLLLKNTTDAVITTRPSFLSATGDQEQTVELPTISLGAGDIVDLDLNPLIKAVAIRTRSRFRVHASYEFGWSWKFNWRGL